MNEVLLSDYAYATLTQNEFESLSRFIYEQCGIRMLPIKKTMLETRLRKRLRVLELKNFSEYCDLLFSNKGFNDEIVQMIDVVTTNKTDFFREPSQFNYLAKVVLPELMETKGAGVKKKLKVWSAGCSTGEEPYTLTIVLSEFANQLQKYDFSILATDISTRALEKAILGIYDFDCIEPIPIELKRKYLLKNKDKQKQVARVSCDLRKLVCFKRLNFMDEDFGFAENFDVIFCRNVIIYFDKETQEELITKLCNYLNTGGYLFLGHSETILNMNLPMIQVAPSTYKKIK
jgi:chemotaxis protein methyltransferase CheR